MNLYGEQKNTFLLFLLLISILACPQNITSTEIAIGVWKGVAGKPQVYHLVRVLSSIPNGEALKRSDPSNNTK